MNPLSTPEARAKSRARCEAATTGDCKTIFAIHGPVYVYKGSDWLHPIGGFGNQDEADFDAHARTDLPAALDIIDALCEFLNEDYDSTHPNDIPPDWVTVALALKDEREGRSQPIDEVIQELEGESDDNLS
jgi:hypothetical protein